MEFVEFLQELYKKTEQKLAYSTKYRSNYYTNLYQTFTISRYIGEDYKTSISFAVA